MGFVILPLSQESGAYYEDLKDVCVKVEGILKKQEDMKEVCTNLRYHHIAVVGFRIESKK